MGAFGAERHQERIEPHLQGVSAMWSDAARASSMQSRGGSLGGGGATGGTAVAASAGNVSGGSQGIQGRLAAAGAGSRGQWSKAKGTHEKITIEGAAHQAGVNNIVRNIQAAGQPLNTLPPSYYPNVAKSSYGYGNSGMPGL